MERENLCGLTRALTQESSETIILKELASTSGLMAESIMATGSTTRCRVTEPLLGQMAEDMWDSTSTI